MDAPCNSISVLCEGEKKTCGQAPKLERQFFHQEKLNIPDTFIKKVIHSFEKNLLTNEGNVHSQ